MFRASLLYLSEQPQVFKFVRSNALAKKFASRFVAGETLDTAVAAVRELNARKISASLDLLGESVSTREEAQQAADTAIRMLERIAADKLDANISVKLTQFGLDLDAAQCIANTTRILERARALLCDIGLEERAHHYPVQLSGGEQQRVAVARAVCRRPRLLLADEPTGNLDSATGKQIIELLVALNENLGSTLVLVTHDGALASHADRIVTLRDGRIVSDEPTR